jgi:hypothetical protein
MEKPATTAVFFEQCDRLKTKFIMPDLPSPVFLQLHHDGLAQQLPAEQHPVADFILVQMPGKADLGKGHLRFDPQHETEPRTNEGFCSFVFQSMDRYGILTPASKAGL